MNNLRDMNHRSWKNPENFLRYSPVEAMQEFYPAASDAGPELFRTIAQPHSILMPLYFLGRVRSAPPPHRSYDDNSCYTILQRVRNARPICWSRSVRLVLVIGRYARRTTRSA